MGRVRSVDKMVFNGFSYYLRPGRVLAEHLRTNGYYCSMLFKNGKYKCFAVHRLVAMAFIPNPENDPWIDHIDTNPKNNKVSNLRWCTPKENCANPITKKKALSSLKYGEENRCYGKKWPQERRDKMSKTIREKGFTPEQLRDRAERARRIPRPHRGEHHFSKKIAQYSKDGELLKVWDCLTDAAEFYHTTVSAITNNLKGRSNSCAGFVWKYSPIKK